MHKILNTISMVFVGLAALCPIVDAYLIITAVRNHTINNPLVLNNICSIMLSTFLFIFIAGGFMWLAEYVHNRQNKVNN